ncbi:MAG: hypothetical protein AAFP77_13290 [Bacteroidota bacterium]
MRVFCYFLLWILLGCGSDDQSIYSQADSEGWHKIDLGRFELSTPKRYEFIPRRGIDSFVGEISDGTVQITFDYGCYSSQGPKDTVEALTENASHISISAYATYLLDYLDHSAYQDGNSINLTELMKDIHDVQLLEYSDSVELSTPTDALFQYYYSFQFNGENYKVPFEFDHQVLVNEARFEFKRDTIDNIYRKRYFDTTPSDTMKYGIYMVDLSGFSVGMNTYCTKLGLVANGVSDEELETVKRIIDSIRFKE